MIRAVPFVVVLSVLAARAELPPPRVVDVHGDLMPAGAIVRLGKVRIGQGLDHLALSPDGKTIRCLRWGVYVEMFDYDSGRLIGSRTLPTEPVDESCLAADGRSALLLRRPDGWNGPCQLEFWDLDGGKRRNVIRASGQFASMFQMSGDGRFAVGVTDLYGPGNNKSVQFTVWDAGTGAQVGETTIAAPSAGNEWVSVPIFSPNNRFVLYACGSGGTGFYYCMDRATVKVVWQKTYAGAGFSMIMPDGRLLIPVPDSARAVSWADGAESPVRLPPKSKESVHVGFAGGGKMFLYITGEGAGRKVRAWDWQGGRPMDGMRPLPLGPNAWASGWLTRDPTDVWVIDGGLRRYDLRTGRPLWPDPSDFGHRAAVTSLVFSSDGRTLASASEDMSVRLWDVGTARSLGRWPAAPTGGYWEWDSGISQSSFGTGPPAVDLSADGRRLALVDPGDGNGPAALRVIDTRTGQPLGSHTLPLVRARAGNPTGFGRIRFAVDGTCLWTSYGEWDADRWSEADHTLSRWDLVADRWRDLGPVRPGPPVRCAAAGNRWLAAGEAYDAGSGRRAFGLTGYAYGPLALSPDGRLAAGLGRTATRPEARFPLEADREVRVWDARTGQTIARLPWSPPARSVSPEGGPPVVGGAAGAGAVDWPRQFAFHPSGRLLVTSDPSGVRLWDLVFDHVIHAFPVPNRPPLEQCHGSPATALAFSPDGTRLATGLPDGTILLWAVPAPTVDPPKAAELPALGADFMGPDPARGWRAAWRLTDDPAAAVRLIREHLQPAAPVPAEVVARLLADADSAEFRRREAATRRLEAVIDRVRPAVEAAEQAATSAELRERLRRVLAAAPGDDAPLSATAAAQARAVAVLEHLGTPEARAALARLAGGAPGAWLTGEAKAALDRIRESAK